MVADEVFGVLKKKISNALAEAKQYTDDTAVGMGAVKGISPTVKHETEGDSIKVTFTYKDDETGVMKEDYIEVKQGSSGVGTDDTPPTDPTANLWINPNGRARVINEIDDSNIREDASWSSAKVNRDLAAVTDVQITPESIVESGTLFARQKNGIVSITGSIQITTTSAETDKIADLPANIAKPYHTAYGEAHFQTSKVTRTVRVRANGVIDVYGEALPKQFALIDVMYIS